jgi:hypothetical protein
VYRLTIFQINASYCCVFNFLMPADAAVPVIVEKKLLSEGVGWELTLGNMPELRIEKSSQSRFPRVGGV